MTFPPFTGFIRRLVLANLMVFFVLALLSIATPRVEIRIAEHLALTPIMVMHGEIWQVVTYSFLHGGILDILFAMLSIWFIGSLLESSLGSHCTAEAYFVSVLGAAATAIAISYTGLLHLSPFNPVAGSAGGVFGIFTAFAVLYGDQEMMLFPLPMRIRAKYLIAIYILVAVASMLRGGGLGNIAYLGGALFGWLFVKFAPRKGFTGGASEWYYGLRNAYYRNKRRRAAKKFEVYMKSQGRTVRFDGSGRQIEEDPEDKKRWN